MAELQAPAPIIVTAGIDAESQCRLDELRERYFPPGRTVLGAHLTLFHAIPPTERIAVHTLVRTLAEENPAFSAALPGLYSLGRGVAVRVASPQLVSLRDRIAAPRRDLLTPQDAQPFRPHITLTNKLSAAEAKEAFNRLQAEVVPAEVTVRALVVWHYLGPHWQLDLEVPLSGQKGEA